MCVIPINGMCETTAEPKETLSVQSDLHKAFKYFDAWYISMHEC